MVEISNIQIGGVILTVLILSSGATIYLQETGSYKNCNGGWALTETGQYHCESRDIYEWCHHLSSSAYRCYLGIPIEIEEEQEEAKVVATKDYTTSPDGKTCYIRGNLRWRGDLKNGLCVKV